MNKDDYTFPHESITKLNHGLTVRDYIAIKAMQGILANPKLTSSFNFDAIAEKSYKISDAMIEQSEEE